MRKCIFIFIAYKSPFIYMPHYLLYNYGLIMLSYNYNVMINVSEDSW